MDKVYTDAPITPAPAMSHQTAAFVSIHSKKTSALPKDEILRALRRKRHDLLDEAGAWAAIIAAADRRSDLQPASLVYDLGIIYARHTGAMPSYTNSDNETHFERFAGAVLAGVAPRVTQNQLRGMIRKLDAKRNPQFQDDVKLHAAE